MIPRTDCKLVWHLPSEEPWTPDREDLENDDSYAGFHGTWPIVRIGARLAKEVITAEAQVVGAVADVAETEEEFETLLAAIQYGAPEDVPVELRERKGFDAVACHFDSAPPPGEGLDLGVAGLVYAIACVRLYPAASCRGHNHWSSTPVIRLGARLWRAERLLDIARRNHCAFHDDDDALLTVRAGSIEDMMHMASDILDHRNELNAPRIRRRRGSRHDGTQLALDI